MSRDYVLPEVDLTVDDLVILPDETRYELIEGRLDLWDRQPLPQLAGLALMAELKAGCPPGFRVVPRMPLGVGQTRPDVVVLDPAGDVVLAVDVIRRERRFAQMLDLMQIYSARGVPACWVFEVPEDWGASLTVFRATPAGGYEAEFSSIDDFATESPFPVSIDIARLSQWWPQAFEYVGKRHDEDGRG